MKNVLLVDDEQEAVDVFQAALSDRGNNIFIAKNANEALALCSSQKFDVLIIDEMMPDMSGNELIKNLRGMEALKVVPIIVLTNYSDDNLVKEAMTAGANDYILKYQMVPEDLAEKVRKLTEE